MKNEMTPVILAGMKTDLDTVLAILHQVGCIQIDPISENVNTPLSPLLRSPETRQLQQHLENLLAHIEGVILQIGEFPHEGIIDESSPSQIEEQFTPIRVRVAELREQLDKLTEELETLPRYQATLRKLVPLIPENLNGQDSNLIGALLSREHHGIILHIREKVNEVSDGRVQLIDGVIDDVTQGLLIVTPHDLTDDMEKILGHQNVPQLRLPEGYKGASPDLAIRQLERRMNDIPGEIRICTAELNALKEQWGKQLISWKLQLKNMLLCYKVRENLAETEYTFVLFGWVPQKELTRIKEALSPWAIDYEELSLSDSLRSKAPVVQNNIGPVRSFEGLVKIMGVPQYGGLDPSTLMAIFLPIFFGMMLGDIGYGLVILLATGLSLRKFKKGMLRDLVWVIMMGALWSIGFGFAYGEFFGTLGEHVGLHPLLFDRAHPEYTASLLLMTLGVGVVHTTLGLLLGIWEGIKQKHRSHVLERGGMLIGLVGLFALAGGVVDLLPNEARTIGLVILIIGLVMLMIPLGAIGIFLGPLEFIGMIGNILSYLRIAAIGLASVYLAYVANEFAGSMGSVVVGVLVAILIHALNIVLGAFSPTIHSLRLHYVEFFRKFYEGGGRLFTPFASIEE